MSDSIQAVSISRLHKYEACARQAYIAYVEKVPEPERPPTRPDGSEWPNSRGDRVHQLCEDYVTGKLPEPPREARHFVPHLAKARALHSMNRAQCEEWWLFDRDWGVLPEPDGKPHRLPKGALPPKQVQKAYGENKGQGADYKLVNGKIWARVRTDLRVWVDPEHTHLLVVDYKTGARFGNEVKHADQMNSYVVSAFLRYPKAKVVTTELWYLDQNEIHGITVRRSQHEGFFANLNRRYTIMCEDRVFRPRPNSRTCFFCPYKTGPIGKGPQQGTGHCKLNP